jgi:hypothetical protein
MRQRNTPNHVSRSLHSLCHYMVSPSLTPLLAAAAPRCVCCLSPLQDDVFQNTYGFGRDSAKADKELGDFKNMFFNADASAAAAPMEVRKGCRWSAWEVAAWPGFDSAGVTLQATARCAVHRIGAAGFLLVGVPLLLGWSEMRGRRSAAHICAVVATASRHSNSAQQFRQQGLLRCKIINCMLACVPLPGCFAAG